MSFQETIIFTTKIPDNFEIPIFNGDPPEQIKAVALEISGGMANQIRKVYSLIFRDAKGDELERLQFDTLDIALDQARRLVGINRVDWTEI